MDDPFVSHCLEILSPLGEVKARKMFGGLSLSIDGANFAMVDDGELWLKGDSVSQEKFREAGARQFTFDFGDGKMAGSMNYWTCPDGADSWESVAPWAELAFHSALAAKAKKGPKKPKQ